MPALSVKNISKIFGKGHTAVKAVDGVSFNVNSREVVLIMGPSGSGKTTLLSIIGGLLRPTSGNVEIKNKEITGLTENKLARVRLRNIGFVFQAFNLLSALTTQENVEIVLELAGIKKNKVKKRVRELLEKVGLGQRATHKPAELSGGEQQRVAVARALALDPDIILADEPTGNLDSKTGHDVISLLCKVVCDEGRSVLIASHDQRIRDIADRVLWLEDGKIKKEERVEYKERDPVCGMKIDREKLNYIYQDKTYYFCSSDCLEKFQNNPESYSK